ncbi:MAG: hypothetical protein LC135_14580 [Phycisphaerae bacterium]|nr:hypothetical protein [Phycisphaerae bacterium]MCZ2401069.1 hypothetical protein [Phycisphaerae bacterium]
MAVDRQAVVVRTGQREQSDHICRVLRDAGITPVECLDALEACLHLLRNPQPTPEAVFIGVDWLTREDHVLVGYVRQTWPSVLIVLHGEGGDAVPAPGRPAILCRTAAELGQTLASVPEGLAAIGREQFGGAAQRLSGGHARRGPAIDVAAPVERDPPARGTAAAAAVQAVAAVEPPGRGPEPPRTILTQEELDALLRDSGV